MHENDLEPDPYIRRLNELAALNHFPIEAYQFAIDAIIAYNRTWETYRQLLDEHFLSDYLNDYSFKRFGATTRSELEKRSICSGKDLREIYLQLIDAELISDEFGELVESLEDDLDFDEAFKGFRRPELIGNFFQWRVSTLFFVTTVAAVAVVGANKLGLKGGFATLFSVWIAGLGLYSLIMGSLKKSKGWQLNVFGGMALFVIGVSLFYILVT